MMRSHATAYFVETQGQHALQHRQYCAAQIDGNTLLQLHMVLPYGCKMLDCMRHTRTDQRCLTVCMLWPRLVFICLNKLCIALMTDLWLLRHAELEFVVFESTMLRRVQSHHAHSMHCIRSNSAASMARKAWHQRMPAH